MSAGEVAELLRLLQRGVGQPAVALQCRCETQLAFFHVGGQGRHGLAFG